MADPYRAHQPFQGGSNDAPTPLTMTVCLMHPAVDPAAELVTYAVVKVRAVTNVVVANRPQVSAVLVLDVSSSMRGEPIQQVITSACRVAELLEDRDQLGIVTFSDGAHTIAALETLGERRRVLMQKIGSIATNYRTNIAGGLAQGALLFPPRQTGERQVVVLMSDGEPNVGATSPEELGAAARLLKARDIGISTLGFGAHHNDAVLEAIADGGGGRYQFVIDPKMSESSFIRALGAQIDIVAERNALLISPSEHVDILRVLDAPPTSFGAGGLRLNLQDLLSGDELCFVVELRVRAPRDSTLLRTISCKLTGQIAGTGQTFETNAAADTHVTLLASKNTDPVAHAAVTLAKANELRTMARTMGERGNYGGAEKVLRDAQALIEGTPGYVKGQAGPLDDAWEALTDDITVMQKRLHRNEYEKYKKSMRAYGEFGAPSTRARSAMPEPGDESPSSRVLLELARRGSPIPDASLFALSGPVMGKRFAIDRERFVIGRAPSGVDVVLADPTVSRQNAVIQFANGAHWLIDMGSTNAPKYNGKPVERLRLEHGMLFEVGQSRFRFELG